MIQNTFMRPRGDPRLDTSSSGRRGGALSLIVGWCTLGFSEGTSMAETVSFDQDQAGALPSGWKSGATGRGSPKWTVEKDDTAPSPPNVLKQSGNGTFPWCVKSDTSIENGSVEVKFKPISG